jgi:hypothetical protein
MPQPDYSFYKLEEVTVVTFYKMGFDIINAINLNKIAIGIGKYFFVDEKKKM